MAINDLAESTSGSSFENSLQVGVANNAVLGCNLGLATTQVDTNVQGSQSYSNDGVDNIPSQFQIGGGRSKKRQPKKGLKSKKFKKSKNMRIKSKKKTRRNPAKNIRRKNKSKGLRKKYKR